MLLCFMRRSQSAWACCRRPQGRACGLLELLSNRRQLRRQPRRQHVDPPRWLGWLCCHAFSCGLCCSPVQVLTVPLLAGWINGERRPSPLHLLHTLLPNPRPLGPPAQPPHIPHFSPLQLPTQLP